MTDAGIDVTRELAVDGPTVEIGADPVTDVSRELAESPAFQRALLQAVRDLVGGHTPAEARKALREAGVDALGGVYRDLCLGVASGDERAAWDLLAVTRQVGHGQTSIDLRSDRDDVLASYPPVFATAETTPTVSFRLTHEFREARASHRRDVLELVLALADGCDVRLVTDAIGERFLVEFHGEELPVSVHHQIKARPTATDVDDAVATAWEALDLEGRDVRILQALAETDTGVMAYQAVRNTFSVSRSRIAQHVSTLVDLDLVDKYGRRGHQRIELRPAGRQFVDRLESEIGVQRGLAESVNGSRQSVRQSPCSPTRAREGGEPPAAVVGSPNRAGVNYLPQWRHVAATASAPETGIAAVERPVIRRDDGREPALSYDSDADRLVVSVEIHRSLQCAVSTAIAFTSGHLRSTALPPGRLDDVLSGADWGILRDARCIGWLSDNVGGGADLWEELTDARETLLDLTQDLYHADPDDEAELRREIMQLAHGLAGTVAHLLDRAGVDVTREYTVPNYREFKTAARQSIAETVAKTVMIQAKYGEYSAYRALFEERDDKRATAMEPRVDAADPLGSPIGNVVLVGPRTADLARRVRDELEGRDPVDDAPEFAVQVAVDDVGPAAIRDAVTDLCDRKRLHAPGSLTAIVAALVSDPYDAARAIHALEAESIRRELRRGEVRTALATLPHDRLLPDAAPTAGKLVAALLAAEAPLDAGELATAADVSERSVDRNCGALTALDVVRVTDAGLRLALPFDDETGVPVPDLARDRHVAAQDVVPDVADALLEDHPDGAFAANPADRLEAYRGVAELRPFVDVALTLGLATIDTPPDPDRPTITVGPDPTQAALTGGDAGA